MTTDRLLGIVAVVIGLPAFFAVFFSSEHRIEGAFTVVIVLLILTFAWWYSRERELPQFTSLELRKTCKNLAADGSLARAERLERLRCNHKGVTEWWNRNLRADGGISNVQIDRQEPSVIAENIGATDLCKRFERPLWKSLDGAGEIHCEATLKKDHFSISPGGVR